MGNKNPINCISYGVILNIKSINLTKSQNSNEPSNQTCTESWKSSTYLTTSSPFLKKPDKKKNKSSNILFHYKNITINILISLTINIILLFIIILIYFYFYCFIHFFILIYLLLIKIIFSFNKVKC